MKKVLLKISINHRCFSVNFAKLLRIPFLPEKSKEGKDFEVIKSRK